MEDQMVNERKFRLQMTVSDRDVQVVFDLLHDVARDIKMVELHDEVTLAPAPVLAGNGDGRIVSNTEKSVRWAMNLWPEVEVVFRQAKASGSPRVRYDDKRLKLILTKAGHSPNTITPLLSELRRMGKLVRPNRGWYTLS
jgi:hypothetical protein